MPSIKRVSVIGAGAVGAFYAAKFFEMDEDCISLIAKGERCARLKKEGLIVNNRRYALPVIGAEDEAPPSDLIIVAVKHHHLPEAIYDMGVALGENSLILSVMNGIESEERIGSVYGMEKVLYGIVVGIDAVREGNAITCSENGKLFFGEARNRTPTERVRDLQSLFDRAEIPWETPDDMIRVLWWKFMINIGLNQVSAVLRAPYEIFQNSQEARELMESAMKEVIAVAQAENVSLSEEDIKVFYPFLSAMSPQGKTSMLQDVEAKRKTEVEMFAGKLNELGEKHGIPTPVNQTLFRLLRITERFSS